MHNGNSKGKDRMLPLVPIILIGIAGTLFLVPPVAAALVLTNTSFAPALPLVPGPQEVTATLVIVPSGGTTFSRGHEIQMQTGLGDAGWNIQVVVDGIPAAQQTATGTAAFVNGALISYPTSHDVSVVVTISGMVPATASPEVVLLQAEEIDNGGNVVPGSVLTLSRPVSGLTIPVTATTTIPATIVPPSTSAKVPGFPALAGIVALVPGWLAAGGRLQGWNRPNGR